MKYKKTHYQIQNPCKIQNHKVWTNHFFLQDLILLISLKGLYDYDAQRFFEKLIKYIYTTDIFYSNFYLIQLLAKY